MMLRAVLWLAALCTAYAGIQLSLAQEPDMNPRLMPDTGTVRWDDVPNEAQYHVSGSVSYLPPPSCLRGREQIPGEGSEFDEVLPANNTSFALPTPRDTRLSWRKDVIFNVQALDGNGNVLAYDGFASQGDQFCTEEEIAAELAVLGGAPTGGSRGTAVLVALLAAAGVAAVAGGLTLRRRKA
jgi:hypothetical protein